MHYAIGIDAGATNIKAVALGTDRTVVVRRSGPTLSDDGSASEAVRRELAALERQMHDRTGQPAQAIGLAAPGLAARDGRSIADLPGRDMDIVGLDWTTFLGRDVTVPVLNDAHAALVGEVAAGAAGGARDAVLLTLGTGVGGAIMCDGRLLRGHLGRAGHLGHICLDPDGPLDICNAPGSLEDCVSNANVAQRTGGRFHDTRALVEAHLAGDAHATQAWERTVWCLACGITSIVNAVDPEVIILGGGIALAGDALFEPLDVHLDRIEWRPGGHRVRLVPAQLADSAGAIGAAVHAMTQQDDAPISSTDSPDA